MAYLPKEEHITITEHIGEFKGLCDNVAIGKPVPDQEKVFYILLILVHTMKLSQQLYIV